MQRFQIFIFATLLCGAAVAGQNKVATDESEYEIAFASFAPMNTDIFVADADGRNAKPLLAHPESDYNASFSPDGKWIAFASARGGFKDESVLHPLNPQPYGDIYVMRADGSDVRMLTDNQFEEATPAWIPFRRWKQNPK